MAGHGGHSADEGDEIVLHQEKLLPTMLLATAFAIIVLFGLATAGGTRFEVQMGKAAFDKVQSQMPKSEMAVPMHAPKAQYKSENEAGHSQTENSVPGHQDASQPEQHNEAASEEHGH